MNLDLLVSFCRVVDLGSFTAAANSLHVSQPVISAHVKALEERFCVRLLTRSKTQALPTAAGDQLYALASHILGTWHQAEDALRPSPDRLTGSVVIGIGYSISMYVLPPVLAHLKAEHPGLQVRIAVMDRDLLQEGVLSQQIDLAIADQGIHHRRLKSEGLFEDEQVVIAAAGHPLLAAAPIRPAHLTQYPFFLWERGSPARSLIDQALRQVGVPALNVAMELSGECIKHAVRTGLGLGFVSRLSVQQDLRSGSLQILPVEGLRVIRHHQLVWRRGTVIAPAVEALRAYLRSEVPKQVSVLLAGSQPPPTQALRTVMGSYGIQKCEAKESPEWLANTR